MMTNTKLTKSILLQMQRPTLNALLCGIVHGYICGLHKELQKVILIEFEGDYFIIPTNWHVGETPPINAVYRSIGRFSQKKSFESEEKCAEWYAAYKSAVGKAVKQIYF